MSLIARDDLVGLVSIAYNLISVGQVLPGREMLMKLSEVYHDNQTINCGIAFSYLVVDEFETGDSMLARLLDRDDVFDDTISIAVLSKFLQKDMESVRVLAARIQDKDSTAQKLVDSLLDFNQ